MSSPAKEWAKCTVAELKAELTKRGLSSTGNKLQLINSLKDSDKVKKEVKEENGGSDEVKKEANGMDVDDENKTQSKKDAETDEDPQLSKGHFTISYHSELALKTVIIKPFNAEFIGSTLSKWVGEAQEFNIRKNVDGVSAGMLVLKTVEEGDAAFNELKAEFGSSDADVYHLCLNAKYDTSEGKTFEHIFKDDVSVSPHYQRQVILENLPESVTVQSIKELFPEAYNVLTHERDPLAKGIITMEFSSLAKGDEIIEKNAGLTIEGSKILVSKLSTRQNKWSKKRKAENKKFGSQTNKADFEGFTDEERLEKCKEYHNLKTQIETIQDRDDIFGYEKITEHEKIVAEWKKVSEVLRFDTERRLKAKQSLPEPAELKTAHAKAVLSGKPREGVQKKVDTKPKSAGAGVEAKKRASTTSFYKGSPPQKKQNFSPGSAGTYSKFKTRGGGSYSAGRGGGYGSSSQGFSSRGGMRGGMGGQVSSLMGSGGMGGGYGRGMSKGMGGGMGGAMGGGAYGGGSGFGDSYGYDGPASSNAMESMIMNLTDKLSRLERMQMGSTQQSDSFSSGFNRGGSGFDRGSSGFNRGSNTGGFNRGSSGYGSTGYGFSNTSRF